MNFVNGVASEINRIAGILGPKDGLDALCKAMGAFMSAIYMLYDKEPDLTEVAQKITMAYEEGKINITREMGDKIQQLKAHVQENNYEG